MHRTQTYTLLFAAAAALVTLLTAVFSYRSLSAAFEREFDARLAQVAGIAASQVSAEDLADVRRLGAESGAFFSLQAQLDPLCVVTGFTDLAIVDSAGVTLYDVRLADAAIGRTSAFDSLAHDSLARAFAGRVTRARPYLREGAETRAAFVPIKVQRRVLGVMVAEGQPSWGPELHQLQRRLALVTGISIAAIAVLAGILMRVTGRQLTLERRLSRSENLAAMGRLTATLAHEIKNPLAIIRGSAKRLGKLEPESQRMADSVVEEVDRLTRTVGRYLQFARGQESASEQGDLAVALASTLDLLEGEFRARGVTLVREGTFDPAAVAIDTESLKQVCLNLVLNALEALPEGGRVQAGLVRTATMVTLTVRDNGPGIPGEVLRRLGEPFFTTKAQGTGLGLFLTRRLVEGAGGKLRVDSAPGAGASVHADFPLSRG